MSGNWAIAVEQSEAAALHVYFIGVDLAIARPSDCAVLDRDLNCEFGTWTYREDGSGIIPDVVGDEHFVLAIDGPQGLAGGPAAAAGRQSEMKLNAPARMPYGALGPGVSGYSQYAWASLRLFRALVKDPRFKLLGLNETDKRDATLIEVFPGAAWRALAGEPLSKKTTRRGRTERQELLSKIQPALRFPTGDLATHDQLDAALSAWIARELHRDEESVCGVGEKPWFDEKAGFLREGYIVQPSSRTVPKTAQGLLKLAPSPTRMKT